MNQLLESMLTRLWDFFDPDTLGPLLAKRLVDIMVGLIIMVVFYVFWLGLQILLLSRLKRSLDKTSAAFFEAIVKYTILGIGVLAALSSAGIQTTAVLASLGVFGLTIGFAARDALSNLISGILIFLDRPFTIGDLVEIEGNYGQVEQITLRSTRIVTSDGKMLAVPNTEVINKTVASYTNFPHLRLDIAVTVAVTEDLNRARKILLTLVQEDSEYLSEPPPRVVVTQLNDYNTTLELRAWIDDERQHVQKRFELREKVFKALTAAGVEMPFETIQLAPHKVVIDKHGNADEK